MNTKETGDALEDYFYRYLMDQKQKNSLVYDVYPSELCEIHRKKKYYCHERGKDIEFDVVIEIRRKGKLEPHSIVIFECKNYKTTNSVPETDITDFSDKLSRIAKHNAKGVLVFASRLQSGAMNLAEKRKIGIVKYENDGLEFISERRCKEANENQFIKNSLFENNIRHKPLKFSARFDSRFFNSIQGLINWIDNETDTRTTTAQSNDIQIPFLSNKQLEQEANMLLRRVNYQNGPVNLEEICSHLSIDLDWDEQQCLDGEGYEILGKADFEKRKIHIYSHENANRKRFTISHEIGHFYLNHDRIISSEPILEEDLMVNSIDASSNILDKLEFQANVFASCLLLPREEFLKKIDELRNFFGMRDRGHGEIFVDNQSCNLDDYHKLISSASIFFETSKQVVEIRLKKMGKIVDQRQESARKKWGLHTHLLKLGSKGQ